MAPCPITLGVYYDENGIKTATILGGADVFLALKEIDHCQTEVDVQLDVLFLDSVDSVRNLRDYLSMRRGDQNV